MKKTLILIFVGALLGSTVAFAASKFFSDVPANTWYSDAVASLSDKGIIAGYTDGTFGPTKNVNRAELAVMLDRLIEYMETGEVATDSKTYSDSTWGISLTYPNNLDLIDRGSTSTTPVQLSLMEGENELATIKVRKDAYGGTYTDETANQNLYYLDQEATSDIQWGNQSAKRFNSDGYCDGPSCGDPYVAVSFVKNLDQYVIVFPGDKTLSSLEKELLDNFEFSL